MVADAAVGDPSEAIFFEFAVLPTAKQCKRDVTIVKQCMHTLPKFVELVFWL